MKKIVILLITITGLFSQVSRDTIIVYEKDGHSWARFKTNPYILRDIQYLDNTYLSHYNIARFGLRDMKIHTFITTLQNHMVYSIEGKHNITRAGKILDIAQRYKELEEKYTTEMNNLDKELENIPKVNW